MTQVAVAKTRHLKITARKLREVVAIVKGKNVNEAYALLTVSPKKAAAVISKTLRSAVANVNNRDDADSLDLDQLFIEAIYVDEGPTSKRWMPRAMGRATSLLRRTSHLTIGLGLKD